MSTYPAESFYRGTIRQSIANNTSVPFTLKVSKIPTLTSGLLTVSPNTANEEIIEYSGVDGTALTITVTKRGISPSAQALTVNGTDYNNATYQKAHSQNDTIRGDVNHLHIIQDYGDFQLQINTKLTTIGGLRTGFGTDKHIRVNRTTGIEEVKNVTSGASILPTDIIRLEKSSGDYEDVPYSVMENGLLLGSSQDAVAGEALSVNDSVLYEYAHNSFGASTSGVGRALTQKMGDVAGNTRVSMMIVGNGVSASSLILGLWKTGAPTDNLIVRIETDNAGVPSGTLANANATANVAGTGLTTSPVNTTVNFAGAFTLTNNVLYHIVIQRQNVVDGANNYNIAAVTKNVRFYKRNLHNGTNWGTASGTVSLHLSSYAGAYGRVVVKTLANITELANFDGIVMVSTTIGGATKINIEGLMSGFTGLIDGAAYYITNTAGAISTTPGTTIKEVGYAVGGTKLYIKNRLYNVTNSIYTLDNIQYYLNEGAVQITNTSITLRVMQKCRIYTGTTFSGGNGTLNVFVNNTTARTVTSNVIPTVSTDVNPGDLVTINWILGSGEYGRVLGFQELFPPIIRLE